MLATLLATLLLAAPIPAVPAAPRSPAFSPDGRLALSIRGDLWVTQSPVDGPDARPTWLPVTSGPALDVDVSWSADGKSLLFASDRSGGWSIWSVPVAGGEPRRITTGHGPDREPAAAPDGSIVFVRGDGPAADLWVRSAAGEERRLTTSPGAERSPAVSPDGRIVVFAATSAGEASLRTVPLEGGKTREVRSGEAEDPAWSPDAGRIAFARRGRDAGVWITDVDGSYENLLSPTPAAPAWAPGAGVIALAELPGADVSFNGDPNRLGDREARALFDRPDGLWLVPAPAPPDAGRRAVSVDAGGVDRREIDAAAFDRVWSRVRDLYFTRRPGTPHRAPAVLKQRQQQWEQAREKYRPRALAAPTDSALESVVHAMMADRPPLREPATGRAAVSSANPVATDAGLEMLRRGGNVVDAAVAVSFALGVVEPEASGIGGYGQMLIWQPGMDDPELVEFMTRTPQDATLDNGALQPNGHYPDDGPILTQVPGTLAGMYRAWQDRGSLPWKELLQPAIRAAENGYEVSDGLAATLATEREHFLKYPGSRALFFREGEPLQAGDTVRNPDLANTLRAIAEGGADAFYHGDVGRRMVEDLRAHGSAMRMRDVERYYAAVREPVSGTYRGYTVFSSAPPSAGGASLAAKLHLLEHFSPMKPYPDDAATLHAMIEAWKLEPSSRGHIADPGLWPVDVDAVTSRDTADARWRCFDPAEATPAGLFSGSEPPACAAGADTASGPRGGGGTNGQSATEDDDGPAACALRTASGHCHMTGTTAFVVADGAGDVVSVTQTLGTWGGTFYVSPGLGFTYNDKLTSYALDPGAYGARLPNARHGSTISPTLVFRGTGADRKPAFAFGTAGNAWITAGVYEELVGLVDFGLSPQAALELPRFLPSTEFLPGGRRAELVYAEDGFDPDVVRRLEAMGHRFRWVSLRGELREGYGAALEIRDGRVTAGADPRRAGAAGAVH